MQIVDRDKLLNGPKEPTPENLLYPEVGRLVMTPWNGAHTAFPMPQMPIAEFAKDSVGATRDIVLMVDEQIRNECQEPQQMVWFVDVTVEAHPMVISNFQVPEASGNFCAARRPLRQPLLEREHGAGILQEDRVHQLLQCRRPRRRCARPLSPKEIGYFIPALTAVVRQALRQGERRGSLQDRHPDQQRRDRRSRLHLHRRSRRITGCTSSN